MIASWKAILSIPVFVWLLAAAAASPPAALATDDVSVETVEFDIGDGIVPEHGACSYFGVDREKYLGAGVAGDWRRMKQRAALTNNVMQAIGSTRNPGPRTRGDLFRIDNTPPPSGTCAGIDDCIRRKATAAGVPMAELTTDAEFLRRASLDLTGRIPAPEEVTAFLADASPDKRTQAVERLLATPQWADRWTMFFGDLFRNTRVTAQVNRYPNGRDSFHLFLLQSLRQNMPYDRMAQEMIAASGFSDGRTYPLATAGNGRKYPGGYSDFAHFDRIYNDYAGNPVTASPVGYIVGGRTTGGPVQDTYDSLAFFTARDFLGLGQMDCVLCHDGAGHLDALSVWGAAAKRLEGWRMAAYFSVIQRYQAWRVPGRTLPNNPQNGRRVNANYYYIEDLPSGTVQRVRQNGRLVDLAGQYLGQTEGGNRPDRLHNAQFVAPDYPFAPEAKAQAAVSQSLPLRRQLGLHLTADPQFARAIVNYIWKEFFSRGIVEPADQFDLARLDPANPPPDPWDIQPSHPQLLEWLAAGFRENGYNLKWLMREIATSRTYQLSSRFDGAFNPTHEKYFVRHNVKRLPAEQIHDAIVAAGGIPVRYNASRSLRGLSFAAQFPDVYEMPPGRGGFQTRMFLDAFFRGDRETTPRSGAGSPLQALQLMNGRLVAQRVRSAAGALEALLDQPDDALVTSLYLRVLSRMPSPEELSLGVRTLGNGNREAQASNLMWAMFNKTDFYFNY